MTNHKAAKHTNTQNHKPPLLTYNQSKLQVSMSFFDWGSGGELLGFISTFALCPPPPSSNHGKHQLLLYVPTNIQYSDLGNLSSRHGNLHLLLYVPANIQYSAFPEIHINWRYQQKPYICKYENHWNTFGFYMILVISGAHNSPPKANCFIMIFFKFT